MSETVASSTSRARLVLGALAGLGSESARMDGCSAAAPQQA